MPNSSSPLIEQPGDPKPKNLGRKRLFPRIFWSAVIIFFLILAVLFTKAYNFTSKIFVNKGSTFGNLIGILFHNSDSQLQGQQNGQINILLLGYGGVGHDGPYLTDSMILAEIFPAKKQIVLYSIPRDYYYQTSIGDKINSAYATGFAAGKNDPDYGGGQAMQAISQLTGQTVSYFAAVDFSGFTKAVDKVDGLDVNVQNTFTDYSYPDDANNGYLPPLTFTAGLQHMGGTRALEFARSRHATGIEGSDFARSRRQQLIIEAFKNKVQQLNLVTNASTINDLVNILANHFSTNIQPQELLSLREILSGSQIDSKSFDQDNGYVCPKILDSGEYVLQNCPDISSQDVINFFAGKENITKELKTEGASLILENSGADNNYFQDVKTTLANSGITVYQVAYKGIPLDSSVLYEVNSKPVAEKYLSDQFKVKAQPKPPVMTAKTDLVLIVGSRP